jgi:ParB/RepB/Spo0J family partition protein
VREYKDVEISQIFYSDDRNAGGDGNLTVLAESIKTHGLIDPITLTVNEIRDRYEIIAGRRRLKAVRLLGWKKIPAFIVPPEGALGISLAENVNRLQMHPMDEAELFSKLIADGAVIEEIAKKYDRSVAEIYQRVKLMELQEDLKNMVRARSLDLTGAAMLASLPAEIQAAFYEEYREYIFDEDEIIEHWSIRNFIWKTKNNRLLPGVADKQCAGCKTRTNYTDKTLFPDLVVSEDVCFEGECYNKKWEKRLTELIKSQKGEHPEVKDILWFEGSPPGFCPKGAKTLLLNGCEYEIRKYTYNDLCYDADKAAYLVWHILFTNTLVVGPECVKDHVIKKEKTDVFELKKVYDKEIPKEEIKTLNEKLKTKYKTSTCDFSVGVREKVLEKIIAARAAMAPDKNMPRIYLERAFKNVSVDGKKIFRLYTESDALDNKDYSLAAVRALDLLPVEKLFEMLIFRDMSAYRLPLFDCIKSIESKDPDLLALCGISADELQAFYREAIDAITAGIKDKKTRKTKKTAKKAKKETVIAEDEDYESDTE